jgi:hypothetical protein
MAESTVTPTHDGLTVFPVATNQDSEGSLRIPQVSTINGAGFGDEITDDDRRFASTREPIAYFLIYGVASDITEKWFKINLSGTDQEDPEFDRQVQAQLEKLEWKLKIFTQLVEYERLYGKALVVGGFDDAQNVAGLREEKRRAAQLLQVAVYPKYSYQVAEYDNDVNSLRFGLPARYRINVSTKQSTEQQGASPNNQNLLVHWTRCYECQTRTNGASVLDVIWDDLTCGRNIRWGVSQWIFRTGGGFAVIEFPKEINGKPTTKADLLAWSQTKEFSDITHRKYICIIKDSMAFHFEGAAGATLNPEPFFETNTKQIAKATGFPKSILEGAEAGALTGSEKNDQQYYKRIAGLQVKYNGAHRWVIDCLVESGQIGGAKQQTDSKPIGFMQRLLRLKHNIPAVFADAVESKKVDYSIEWNSSFELDAEVEARIALLTEQANQIKLQYMTLDEVRKLNPNLKELPNGEGKMLKQQSVPAFNPPSSQEGSNSFNQQQPEEKAEEEQEMKGDANVNAVHSEFSLQLNEIIKKAKTGSITEDTALKEATVVIDTYVKQREKDALEYLSKKTGNQAPMMLPPEQQIALDQQRKNYLVQFQAILKDVLKAKV